MAFLFGTEANPFAHRILTNLIRSLPLHKTLIVLECLIGPEVDARNSLTTRPMAPDILEMLLRTRFMSRNEE